MDRGAHPTGPTAVRGVSLVEALVALAVLALALLLGLGLIFQQKRTLLRLEARSAADTALSEALERLRAGSQPLASGPVLVTTEPGPAEELAVFLLVTPAEPPADLYRGRVMVRYRVAGETESRSVETLYWRPGLVKMP